MWEPAEARRLLCFPPPLWRAQSLCLRLQSVGGLLVGTLYWLTPRLHPPGGGSDPPPPPVAQGRSPPACPGLCPGGEILQIRHAIDSMKACEEETIRRACALRSLSTPVECGLHLAHLSSSRKRDRPSHYAQGRNRTRARLLVPCAACAPRLQLRRRCTVREAEGLDACRGRGTRLAAPVARRSHTSCRRSFWLIVIQQPGRPSALSGWSAFVITRDAHQGGSIVAVVAVAARARSRRPKRVGLGGRARVCAPVVQVLLFSMPGSMDAPVRTPVSASLTLTSFLNSI